MNHLPQATSSTTRTLDDVVSKRVDEFKNSYFPNLKIDCDGRPYHAGTITTIEVGGTQLLVTAYHVLKRDMGNSCDIDDNQLHTISDKGLVNLNPFQMSIPKDTRANTRYPTSIDLAVVRQEALAKDRLVTDPIPHTRFHSSAMHKSLYVAACGFPESKNGEWAKKVDRRPYGYFGLVADDSVVATAGYNPETHFAIQIDLKRVFRAQEKKVRAPDPHGISGGPVFVVHDFDNAALKLPTFAGIVIAKDRMKKHLICVRAAVVEHAAQALVAQ